MRTKIRWRFLGDTDIAAIEYFHKYSAAIEIAL
jgi:hypothetical protein